MKKTFLFLIFFFIFKSVSFAEVGNYKDLNYLEYQLFRNDNLIGYHKYFFNREGSKLIVKSDVVFNIDKLGIRLYEYNAKSEEIYENNKLVKFSSKTNQNKKIKYVNVTHNSNEKNLLIDGSSYKGPAALNFIIGTWWNKEIINAPAQISAVSGRIIEQEVDLIKKEKIKIKNKEYKTSHYNFSSSDKSLPEKKKLNTDIWYEEDTFLWVKAAFDKTGYWEYRIKTYK